MRLIFIILIFLISDVSKASSIGSDTGLTLPRYVSLKSNESNLRVGPSKNYPILIKYIVNNLPLKITDEYQDWRKVIDIDNNTGWIHKSLIKSERNGIIFSGNLEKIYIYNIDNGLVIGEIDVGTIIHLSKCKIDWCLISKNKYKGWIRKKNLWGVSPNEEFNISFFQILIDYYYNSINFINKNISSKR